MTVINQPNVNFAIQGAQNDAENTQQKILIVGQSLNLGAVTGELFTNLGNNGEELTMFGAGSMLEQLVRANKVRNQQVQIDAIALTDGGLGVARVFDIDLSGTATEAGVIEFTIGGSSNSYTVSINEGELGTDALTRLETLVNADPHKVANVVVAGTTATFTTLETGTYTNTYQVRISSVDGIVATYTNTTVGGGDPVTTGIFDLVGNQRYQTVLWPYPESTETLTDFLDPRFNPDGFVLDGLGVTAINGTLNDLITLGNSLNSRSLTIIADKSESIASPNIIEGGAINEIPMIKASQFAAIRALRLDTGGFNIADLVVGAAGLDNFSGAALASRPYFNTPFNLLDTIDTGLGFDSQGIEQLKDAGLTVLGNNIAGNTVILGETVTTYKTDAAGNPDASFTFLNYVDTISQIREYFFNNFRARYSQYRLTEGDLVQGRPMINEALARSSAHEFYQDLSGQDFVLVESGSDSRNFFDENLFININKAQGRMSIQMKVVVVTQLRDLDGIVEIAFSVDI